MALSKYDSTKETTNLARVARAILGPCTDLLRDILLKNVKPKDLPAKVDNFLKNYPKHLNPPISRIQRRAINSKNYKKFDISLLYVLLSNICEIPEHYNGWGSKPLKTDNSLSANIERMRLRRNCYYGHEQDFCISDTAFEEKWKDLSTIVKGLQTAAKISGSNYENYLLRLKTCEMGITEKKDSIQNLLLVENLQEKVETLESMNFHVLQFKNLKKRI